MAAKAKAKAEKVATQVKPPNASPTTKAATVAACVGLETLFAISAEDSIQRVRVRFNDEASFSKKCDEGSKWETIALVNIAAAKMLNKAK